VRTDEGAGIGLGCTAGLGDKSGAVSVGGEMVLISKVRDKKRQKIALERQPKSFVKGF
jgi:hypothetical protein